MSNECTNSFAVVSSMADALNPRIWAVGKSAERLLPGMSDSDRIVWRGYFKIPFLF